MNQHPRCRPVRPAVPRLARHAPALNDAARRQRRWPRQAARPSLTAAAYLAWRSSGRDEKTALQPNQKTAFSLAGWRTTHALQTADLFTRHQQRGRARGKSPGWRGRPGN
jgi:hypothetical protein